MNPQREDIGVIHDYDFDLAFGSDENSFELTLSEHICDFNYYIYFEGTEYGGIIDAIKVDTKTKNIVYSGRTWHGILENKVICPDEGLDYLTVNGEANAVLGELIERMELDDLFTASTEDSGVQIDTYDMERFVKGYTGIKKMLKEEFCRLKIEFQKGQVVLSAVPRIDYSNDEEFDSTQVEFTIVKNDRPCNHLICLGSGDLRDRHVIHVFTDANGGICPYATTDTPVEDEDYILDTSQQALLEEDEVTDIYDYPNVQTVENYILLTEEPGDWQTTFSNFYECIDDKYKQLESWEEDVYTELVKKPSDWSDNYQNYYELVSGKYKLVKDICENVYTVQTKKPSDWSVKYNSYYTNSGSTYSSVKSAEITSYEPLKKQPSKWAKNYSDYYYRYSDGTGYEYHSVQGINKNKHVLQTNKPTDWNTNFSSYFKKKSKGSGFEAVKSVGGGDAKYILQKKIPSDWKKNFAEYYYKYSDGITTEYRPVEGVTKIRYVLQTRKPSDWSSSFKAYYERSNGKYVTIPDKSAPKWQKGTYYTAQLYKKAGDWRRNTFYTKDDPIAPKWKKGKYYTRDSITKPPVFEKNKYYQSVKKSSAPTWESGKYYTKNVVTEPKFESNKYYRKSVVTRIPEWKSGVYYKKAIDNFAELVKGAIEKLEESANCDELSIAFAPTEDIYNIGDVVGASDPITGLSLWQPITKKIVNIDKHQIKISYEVGDK